MKNGIMWNIKSFDNKNSFLSFVLNVSERIFLNFLVYTLKNFEKVSVLSL